MDELMSHINSIQLPFFMDDFSEKNKLPGVAFYTYRTFIIFDIQIR